MIVLKPRVGIPVLRNTQNTADILMHKDRCIPCSTGPNDAIVEDEACYFVVRPAGNSIGQSRWSVRPRGRVLPNSQSCSVRTFTRQVLAA